MRGLSLGLGLTRGGAGEPPIITATLAPAAYSYSDGDTVGDHPNFATLDTTGNYASTAGTISTVEWLVDGTDRASSYVLSAGEAVVVRVTDSAANTRDWTVDASVAAVVPDAFTSGDWSVASDGSTVTISTLPDDGGSALTDIEYRVNSGSAVSLGETTTGTYSITASEGDDIEIRAVNAVGNSAWSDTKTVTAAFDSDAQTYITAVETADGQALEAGVKTAINDFVVGLKADGIWTDLGSACILAGARTLSGALVALSGTAPTNVNFVGADYDRETGLTGDGSTKYLDTNVADTQEGASDRHASVYVTDTGGENQNLMGSVSFSNSRTGFSRSTDSNGNARLFVRATSNASDYVFINPWAAGFTGVNRAVSTEFTSRHGGVTDTKIDDAGALSAAVNMYVFGNGAAGDFSGRIAFYSFGAALDLSALETRVNTLITDLGNAIA